MSILNCAVVSLGGYENDESIAAVKKKMDEYFGADTVDKQFPSYEWGRLSVVIHLIRADARSILDIDTG
jgi:hypothetical protein